MEVRVLSRLTAEGRRPSDAKYSGVVPGEEQSWDLRLHPSFLPSPQSLCGTPSPSQNHMPPALLYAGPELGPGDERNMVLSHEGLTVSQGEAVV